MSAAASAHPEHGQSSPWFAHGRDPFFPPWSDTAQMDYRKEETREAMTELLVELASKCDGVRCDMAMLALSDVFQKTWTDWPADDRKPGEFWREAILAVRRKHPAFILIAEVYWDLEMCLQELGFNYTYEKTFLDFLVSRDFSGLLERLCGLPPARLSRSLWFLENHDEARIAGRLTLEERRAAAAVLLLGVPGLPLIYEGQIEGWARFVPVQIGRWPEQSLDPEIRSWHETLLRARQKIAQCSPALSQPAQLVLQVAWGSHTLLVSFRPEPCSLNVAHPAEAGWDELSAREVTLAPIFLPPFGARLIRH